MKTRKHGINGIISLIALTITACISTPEPNKDTKPKAGDIIVSSTGIELVYIPAGTFTMGSPASETEDFTNPENYDDERPQHTVTLGSFYMGKYEVTQEQYQTVMGTNPSRFKTDAGETQNKRPVEQVSWYDTLVFCNKLSILEGLTPAYNIDGKTNPEEWGAVPLYRNERRETISDFDARVAKWDAVVIVENSNGYRLPTEAQWEYACRAGTTTAYNNGDILDNTGWIFSNSNWETHEVGKKPPNAWGLYDMHGNVWEWCWDRYGSYASDAQTDPRGASSGFNRTLRGGGWGQLADYARSAFRVFDVPIPNMDLYGGEYGFRITRP